MLRTPGGDFGRKTFKGKTLSMEIWYEVKDKNLNHYQVTFSKKDNPPKHRIHSQLKDIVIFKGTAKLN